MEASTAIMVVTFFSLLHQNCIFKALEGDAVLLVNVDGIGHILLSGDRVRPWAQTKR